jgi:hypothetical protein
MREKRCERTGCVGVAAWYPVIEVWPIGAEMAGTPPARIRLQLMVCHAHREALVLMDYLGPLGFEALSDALAAMGAARPERATARIAFVAVEPFEWN